MALKSSHPKFSQKISLAVGNLFSKIPLTPNQWTILSILPAFLGFYSLAFWHNMALALAFFAVCAFLDLVDGAVAKVTKKTSKLGAYFDGMVDRFNEAFIIFGLMLYGLPCPCVFCVPIPSTILLAMLLFLGTSMVSFSRAYADHRKVLTDQKKLARMGGVLERAERLLLIFAGMLFSFLDLQYLNYVIILAVILSAFTLAQRVWFVIKNAEK